MRSLSTLRVLLLCYVLFQLRRTEARHKARSGHLNRADDAPSHDSQSKYRTNAQRMAAGLPPLAPARHFDPSRVIAARSDPSALPEPEEQEFRIRLRNKLEFYSSNDGYWILTGHLTKELNLKRDWDGAGVFEFEWRNAETTTEIERFENKWSTEPLGTLGLSTTDPDFATPGSESIAELVYTDSVPADSIPRPVPDAAGNPKAYTQTFVWHYVQSSDLITVSFRNILGDVVPLHIFHDRQLNRLVFSPSSAFGETAVYIPPWWDPENFEPGTEPITEKRYALARFPFYNQW